MKTREIMVGRLHMGGENPVVIQSMTNTDTADIEATAAQIRRLEEAGCELVRVAAYDIASAKCIRKIKDRCAIPIVADVHFDYKIAIAAMEAGADKVRINPGNIGDANRIRQVVDAAKQHHVPIRVGANSGSIGKEFAGLPLPEALKESALQNVRLLEDAHFTDIVVSLKASSVPVTVAAVRALARECDYPQHLGVTEAGIYDASVIKSAIGIGALLLDGIGATIRVSITGDPVREVAVARDILRYTGVRSFGPEVISCPTCGRTRIDVESMAKEVSRQVQGIRAPLRIAVMGCAVNGPGEAKGADVGIAGGKGEGVLIVKGQIQKKLPENRLIPELMEQVEKLAADWQRENEDS